MTEVLRSTETSIMHRVVEYNGTLFLGGVAADRLAEGMMTQAEEVFSKIERLLVENGSKKERLLSMTLFLSDLTQKDAMNAAWSAWLDPSVMPARATIGVADLGPGVLIEAVAVAAK